jgi:hypothetical protein
MDECFFEFKAVDVITKNNLWLFQLKNIGVILLLFLPIIFAKTFNLTNKFYVFGVISMFVIIVFALFFKIGYDTTLSFYLDKIRISKNNLDKFIAKEEIGKIEVISFSGSRAPFIIEIKLHNGDIMKFMVDKFNFQNPAIKHKKLIHCIPWNDLIKLKENNNN